MHSRVMRCKCHQLGWSDIPAVLVELDDVDRMLAAINENLTRNDLPDLERSEHLAEWKRLYLRNHPEDAAGARRATGMNRALSVATLAKLFRQRLLRMPLKKTGRAERAVQQDVQIAERIAKDVRDALRETLMTSDGPTRHLPVSTVDSCGVIL